MPDGLGGHLEVVAVARGRRLHGLEAEVRLHAALEEPESVVEAHVWGCGIQATSHNLYTVLARRSAAVRG